MKIAIIGTGISGLGTAYLLNPYHDITVYEKNSVLGGHSRTISVQTDEGIVPVDTGFIVFNPKNYPLLTGLFRHLNVPTAASNMSFGVCVDNPELEYGTNNIFGLFAQKRNLIRIDFWKMLFDILRFNKNAKQYLSDDCTLSLGECLDDMNMGTWFREYYLLAMGGAIWSTPVSDMLKFPAQTFIRFFDNHGLLTVNEQPQWYTVVGGSCEYVKRLSRPFQDKIKTACGVVRVIRHENSVDIYDKTGEVHSYDKVIFACHSDQALNMLDNPTGAEHNIIGKIKYQNNKMILHKDINFMPKHKSAWASWIYLNKQTHTNNPALALSYWMNNLQPLQTKTPIIVTLNPTIRPDDAMIFDEYDFEHPVFDADAIAAQSKISDIQGQNNTYYTGAWQRYGFHEDGLLSAVNVAKLLGVDVPWQS